VLPDLVLMDIQLQGAMDGIEAAQQIRDRFRRPVVFLTAYADTATLQRAKVTEPFGYILKPFEDSDLKISIEMALYKHRADEDLRLREHRLAFLIRSTSAVIYTCQTSEDYAATFVSENVRTLMGYEAREFLEDAHFWKQHIHPEDAQGLVAKLDDLFTTGDADLEYRFRHQDGTYRWMRDQVGLVVDGTGTACEMVGVWTDITERKQTEIYRETGRQILQILNEPGEFDESIRRVLAVVKERGGFDAVGLRLQVGEDFPYLQQQGFSEEFLVTENTLLGRDASGGIFRDAQGHACLECTCGLVISGKTDPASPLYTRGGSCWTNDSKVLLDLPAVQDSRIHPRNQCVHHGYASVALVPVRAQNRIVGLLQLNARDKGRLTLGAVELMEGVATHIGEAMIRKQTEQELLRTTADLHALSARQQIVREEERASVSRELHDSLGQHLTALQFGLMWMDRHLQHAKPPDLAKLYDKIVAMVPIVEGLTEQIQTICSTLRSSVLDDLGLVAAIEWQAADTARHSDLEFSLNLPKDEEIVLERDIALALFRILQESLTNVIRHARASQVAIRLRSASDAVVLDIEDNGQGFVPAPHPGIKALGLLGMRERAAAFGGTVDFLSEPGKGCTVRAQVPTATKSTQLKEQSL